jgi:hypothetical protein
MKKSLLLAALLLSSAAQAETYVCTSTYGVSIVPDSLATNNLTGRTWIADTREGLRVPSPIQASDDYKGLCETINRTTIFCDSRDSSYQYHSLLIFLRNSGDITFDASTFNIFNFSYVGTCIRI